jgi:hypothetical protein
MKLWMEYVIFYMLQLHMMQKYMHIELENILRIKSA